MSKFIYYLDFFKAPLTFTTNGRQNFSTKLGFLTTIPIFCFLFISFILSDLVQKKHPVISSQSIANTGRPYLRFDKSNMTFSIRITDDNSTADLDPSYFSILVYNLVVNNTSHEVINIDKKKTKTCDENDFLNPNYFKDYGISKAICTSNNDTFEIGGYWTEPFVSYMRILMVPCKNDSNSNIICKSTEQIKEYLKNRYFSFYYHDHNYDMNNYKEPLKTFYQTQFQMIDGGIRKRMTIFFKKVNFINDEGLIFLENNPVESFMFDKMESDFTMDPSDYIFEVLVYSSLETQIMIRSYQKVQDIFASLGGIGSVLMFLGYLIVICEKNFYLNKCVINQLYSFPNGKTEKTKVTDPIIELKTNRLKKVLQLSLGIPEMSSTPKISTSKKKKTMVTTTETEEKLKTDPNYIMPKYISDDDPNSIRTNEKDIELECNSIKSSSIIQKENSAIFQKRTSLKNSFFSKKKTKSLNKNNDIFLKKFKNFAEYKKNESEKHELNISFKEYIKLNLSKIFKCMKRNSNQILYKKALKLISNETDYFNILKKLQEIEKLKLLLLSPEQIQLFNMLSKPMIFENELLSEENKNFDGFMLSVMIENSKKLYNTDNITNILNYYKRIKERKGNEIDERLVELIDRSLQEYINNKKESNISLDH